MRTFDLTPLYRATVGFDQIADLMDRALAKDAGTNSYPPYNIEKTADDSWRISIAVAGFSEDDLSIEVKDRDLVVTARKADDTEERTYLLVREVPEALKPRQIAITKAAPSDANLVEAKKIN